jgi:hypothetical protein
VTAMSAWSDLGAWLAALEGDWDLLATREAAPLLADVIPEQDRDRLPVRSHPWLPPGQIVAMRPERDRRASP